MLHPHHTYDNLKLIYFSNICLSALTLWKSTKLYLFIFNSLVRALHETWIHLHLLGYPVKVCVVRMSHISSCIRGDNSMKIIIFCNDEILRKLKIGTQRKLCMLLFCIWSHSILLFFFSFLFLHQYMFPPAYHQLYHHFQTPSRTRENPPKHTFIYFIFSKNRFACLLLGHKYILY